MSSRNYFVRIYCGEGRRFTSARMGKRKAEAIAAEAEDRGEIEGHKITSVSVRSVGGSSLVQQLIEG